MITAEKIASRCCRDANMLVLTAYCAIIQVLLPEHLKDE